MGVVVVVVVNTDSIPVQHALGNLLSVKSKNSKGRSARRFKPLGE